jgi:hypothetical protein
MEQIYKQLSLEERTTIQTLLSMGFKPGQIARELKRNAFVRPKLPCGELRTEGIGWLRFGHAKRRPHAGG